MSDPTTASKAAVTPHPSEAGADSDAPGADSPSDELAVIEPGRLDSDLGKTRIADTVVSKVAGLAARQVAGVHKLGSPTARALGSLRERIPGQSISVSQGISVEVGERQTAIDLDIVIEYGFPIADVADTIRGNVISAIEDLVGLEVTEVNIAVGDVHLPDDDTDTDTDPEETRVL